MTRKKGKGSKAAKNQITNNPPGSNGAINADAVKPKLTPYQGTRQTFGMFKCQKCNRYWTSNVSWANFGQMCNKCKIMVYPFRQIPLESEKAEKFDKSDPVKHHPQEMCEKCKSLGRFCGKKFRKTREGIPAPRLADPAPRA